MICVNCVVLDHSEALGKQRFINRNENVFIPFEKHLFSLFHMHVLRFPTVFIWRFLKCVKWTLVVTEDLLKEVEHFYTVGIYWTIL